MFYRNINAIFKNTKKIFMNSFFRAKFIYTKYYEKMNIDDSIMLFQCYSGKDMSCNPFFILKAICENPSYNYIRKVVVSNKENYEKITEFLSFHSLNNVEVVILHSRKYCKILASAKYLINNVTFPFYFIKKEGQIYLNTWHGTPLKALGKSMREDMHSIGNVQRNFLMSDYILTPNEFTLDIIRNDYMLNKFFNGHYILGGYPRNHIFYDLNFQKNLRHKLHLDEKKIIVYMPTWRGTHALRNDTEQFYYIMHMLIELDKNIDSNTEIYVKEHNMSSLSIDFTQFEKIKQFPLEYETYEFLSIADCLITDYSSVMFDFANTGRKIILYAYDEQEYLRERGMYIDFNSLPFSKVYNTIDLIKCVNELEKYEDYNTEINAYIKYDKKYSVNDILALMIDNSQTENLKLISGKQYQNDKENVLIFTGSLLRNGITTALKGVLNNINQNEKNYILTFSKSAVAKNKEVICELGDFDYVSVQGQKNQLIRESICSYLYFRFNFQNSFVKKQVDNLYKREVKRIYPNMKFHYIIHYTGYERKFINLFKVMPGEKMIYVHNNLIKESKTRNNVHLPSIQEAYKVFDKIVIIRETMRNEIIVKDVPNIQGKIYLAHNLNNYSEIIKNANLEITFDDNTECNINLDDLKRIMKDKSSKKFINIARFSVEKGLDNLIKAFEKYYIENNKDYLIIIGGHGSVYEDILSLAQQSVAKHRIIIIQSMKNPFSILKDSDVFVLASHYEGLPMVLMEALILKKPIIATNITGPKEFLGQGYGYLVEDSIEGLFEGMHQYKKTSLSNLKEFDYIAFNENAMKEFERLFR